MKTQINNQQLRVRTQVRAGGGGPCDTDCRDDCHYPYDSHAAECYKSCYDECKEKELAAPG